MKKLLRTALGTTAFYLALSAGAQADMSHLDHVIESDHRSQENQHRDVHRHPAETLEFFGITPDMRVAEIWPGKGWYTEILAPWIKANDGKLIAAGFPEDMGPEWRHGLRKDYNAMLAESADLYDEVEVTEFGPGHWKVAEPESLDAVVTFRNVHNWVQSENGEKAFDAFFEALKPGGILGVTDHRANIGISLDEMKKSGYLTEALVIELAREAGFKLEETSEINANPMDSKDHPNGVWTLPPTLRVDQVDKTRYEAIGESDRMTLRFRKPE